MKFCHAVDYAKRHTFAQVPIATFPEKHVVGIDCPMEQTFRDAFLWHFENQETKIADIVRATGISRDVINKLLAREGSSTSAENALLISAYYGKTLEAFVKYKSRGDFGLPALTELLTDDEASLVAAQVRGILAQRGPRPGKK